MKNDCLNAVIAVLEENGIQYAVGDGGKHPRIDFEINGRRCRTSVPKTSGDFRAPLNAASDVRRLIKGVQAETEPMAQEACVSEAGASVTDIALVEQGGEPLALDTDIGTRLGMARPTNIRQLIRQHRAELEQFGILHVAGANSSAPRGRGRPAEAEYLLSEEQALAIATLSQAPNAPVVRAMLIRTFVAWRRGHLAPSSDISSELVRLVRTMAAELADVKAAAELALETAARIGSEKIAATVDLGLTVTSDDLIVMAGIKPGQRVRGTSRMVTNRMLAFTSGHGCFKTPTHLNPSAPWRFPREKGSQWLFGADLGAEQIRNQIERQARKTKRAAPIAVQHSLRLVSKPAE